MFNEAKKPKSAKSGCIMAAILTIGITVLLVLGGLFFIKRAFSNFDSHRGKMAIPNSLAVQDEDLRYSPGIDGAMWSRFTVKANGIDEVFDASRVDTSEFSQDGYKFKVDWIDEDWWDADSRQLIGGEVQIGDDFMRVGYVVNNDGTLTVYIFWMEV